MNEHLIFFDEVPYPRFFDDIPSLSSDEQAYPRTNVASQPHNSSNPFIDPNILINNDREGAVLVQSMPNITNNPDRQSLNLDDLNCEILNQPSLHQPTLNQSSDNTNRPSSMEKALVDITNVFTKTLKNLNDFYTKPNKKPSILFHGYDHDNPVFFIETLEKYFIESNIHDSSERVSIGVSLLRGQAKTWYDPYVSLNLSWTSFKEQFLNKFNQISLLASATSSLYGDVQKPNEPVNVFIAKKLALFARIDPHKANQLKAAVITELLRPELRSRLRKFGKPLSCEELTVIASSVETDMISEINTLKQVLAPSFNSSQPPPFYNYSNNPNLATDQVKLNNKKPPSPCKYCGDWHYHKDCPRNPYTSNSHPENQRRAGQGRISSRPANSSSHLQ